MSQSKIISLKNDEGKVFASIVPMKDGQWLEIKLNGKFQKHKQLFASPEDWLRKRNNRYINPDYLDYKVVHNEREPYVSVAEKIKQQPPIDASLTDIAYLVEVVRKYRIHSYQPLQKNTPQEYSNPEYYQLTKKATIAYIEKNDELVPVGYDVQTGRIVCEGASGKTFQELGFPEHPVMWILKRNRMKKAI